jgi:uncharacterized oxidoreductase
MPSPNPRAACASAVLATLLAMLLGCLQSVIWSGARAPSMARAVASWLEPDLLGRIPSQTLVQPSSTYFAHGHWTIAIYLLLLVAAPTVLVVVSRWAGRLLVLAASIAITGDIVAYWLSAAIGSPARRIGFWFMEVPALAAIVTVLTIAGAWSVWHRRPGRSLVFALPAVAVGVALLHYMPHGVLLGLGLTFTIACARAPRAAFPLAGARVLVTGGTNGIGRATALLLHARGARVVVCARHVVPMPEGILVHACDLTDAAERRALVDRVEQELGGLDVLINNAATQTPIRVPDAPWTLIEQELALNLVAPLHLTSLLHASLSRGERAAAVVNITSALAFAPKTNAPIYCATKAALASLSTTLRAQLAPVRVLEVVPPLVDTAMTRGRAGRKARAKAIADRIVDALAAGRERIVIGPARLLWLVHRASPSLAIRLVSND